ncbi:N-acetylglucosamine kinase [Auraticoccus monumenti]|uniref:BadF-type ATPase n=1 Tax=Auraticoccus monumenti TaxID=675864 RepID=A0A1G6U6I3_9ACTN|nr:BadF/BadG/BcrA/BcrD ATPase family protein [Auraticoccus monumenti]SDD36891.1 BadF-type ATPase [Auraticoccus monumenti]
MTTEPLSPGPSDDVLVGLDVGGTSTKALVMDATGRLLGHAVAPGGNHRSSTGDVSLYLREAVRTALGPVPGSAVRGVAAGIAGAAAALDEVTERVTGALAALGVSAPVDVRTDLDIAFLAAAPGGDGVLLLSGTGAVAGRYQDGRLVQRCDGLGWRLGDEGSGWWIGSTAVRAAVAALDGRGPRTLLETELATALQVPATTGDPRQDWVHATAGLEAPDLARLVPVVVRCAADGDAVATEVLTDAAGRLITTFSAVATGSPVHDAVLAGGVLTAAGPVREEVSRVLHQQGREVHLSTHPVLGAMVLAADLVGWSSPDVGGLVPPAPVRLFGDLST